MRLTLKNAEIVSVKPALVPHRLDVDIDGIEVEALLIEVDILTAIRYYGITELLDIIGEENLKSYLGLLPCNENEYGTIAP